MRRHGAALIEEFIEGTEVTVLVAENPDDPGRPQDLYADPVSLSRRRDLQALPHEVGGLRHDDGLSGADPALDARVRDVCARFFVALGGASFGRCDLRIDAGGTPYMLEINPNCGVYYLPEDAGSADLCLLHDPEGHAGFTRRLIAAALRRVSRPRTAS